MLFAKDGNKCQRSLSMGFLFMKDSHIAVVSIRMDITLFNCLDHFAFRLMEMLTIIVFALSQVRPHLHKIVGEFLVFNIENAKFLDPRGVDNITVFPKLKHFCKGGGMGAL